MAFSLINHLCLTQIYVEPFAIIIMQNNNIIPLICNAENVKLVIT